MGAGNQIGGTLAGAGSGAAAGGMLGGPWGAAAGGLIGGIGGFFSSKGTDDSAAAQHAGLDAAMARLQAFSSQDAQRRANDLQQTMAFYGPADNYLKSIYAQPPPAAPVNPVAGLKSGMPGMGLPRLPIG